MVYTPARRRADKKYQESIKQRRQSDPEFDRQWREKRRVIDTRRRQLHPEKVKATGERSVERNKVTIRKRALAQYYVLKEKRALDPVLDAAVRARLKINNARSYAKNPSSMRQATARYRARKKNAPINDLTDEQWESIKKRFNYRCVYCPPTCKACRNKTHKLTQEHLTPLSKGGSHTFSNVVPACRSCNSRRNNGEVLNPVQPLLLL